jgi:hypothetical protein
VDTDHHDREAAAVTFEAWLARLRNDGYLLCPASTALPVELRAVRPDGWGLHLRCRGVRVQLGLYRPGRSAWQVPLWDRDVLPEDALELWEHRPLPSAAAAMPAGTRIAFTGGRESPDHSVVFDGAHERGWRGHEAGLLRSSAAAEIFAVLLAAAEPELARWHPVGAGGHPPARAAAASAVPAAAAVPAASAATVPATAAAVPVAVAVPAAVPVPAAVAAAAPAGVFPEGLGLSVVVDVPGGLVPAARTGSRIARPVAAAPPR